MTGVLYTVEDDCKTCKCHNRIQEYKRPASSASIHLLPISYSYDPHLNMHPDKPWDSVIFGLEKTWRKGEFSCRSKPVDGKMPSETNFFLVFYDSGRPSQPGRHIPSTKGWLNVAAVKHSQTCAFMLIKFPKNELSKTTSKATSTKL